jgi:nucleotide-binding universal stress UspA family protein
MMKSIFVPLDGSSFAEHALPLALSIARRANATLNVVLVHVPLAAAFAEPIRGMETPSDEPLKARERAYLVALTQKLKKAASIPVVAMFAEGPVVPTIRDQVVSGGGDLVVMTTHGRGALARFWLGSIADQLIRELPVPLLLVRPTEGKADITREQLLRHIMIPLDGSTLSTQAVEPTVELGNLMEADYTLLRVVPPISPLPLDVVELPLSEDAHPLYERLKTLHDEEMKRAGDDLDKVRKPLAAKGLRVVAKAAEFDQPARAILDAAQDGANDCIALATHGRRGLGRLFLGSIADKVIRGATVPVLVYRPREGK